MEHEICLKAIAIAPHLLVKALGGDPVERGKIIVEQPGRLWLTQEAQRLANKLSTVEWRFVARRHYVTILS